jgi:parallel beta-helix repeat protein
VAGDKVQVQAGTYTERVTFPKSGTTSNPIIFTGVRGSGGSWDTVINGSTATSGWVTAPEVGSGVWKTTLGYSPQAIMADEKTIWKISDRAMKHEVLHGTDGNGFVYLARSATAQIRTALGTVNYWDGIEALYGNLGSTTYLRFRHGDNPASRNVRAAPAGGTVTFKGVNNIILRNFRIIGGQWQIYVAGGAQNITIDQNFLATGQRRISVNGGINTTISGNKLTMQGLGTEAFRPGDRNTTSYPRIVNRHQYDQSKFIVGETDTNDASIMIATNAANTTVAGNEIYDGMIGIQISETTTNTKITKNTFHNFSDIGVYIYPDSASLFIDNNLFYDAEHHIRMNAMHRSWEAHIYANRFHQPTYNGQGFGAKHVHFSPNPNMPVMARVWVYQNSFAGGGWACDAGYEGTAYSMPYVHIINNLISTTGMTSGPSPGGWEVTSNLLDKLWYSDTIPDFVLPTGHKARNSGVDLISRGLPGVTTTYYQDGRPDIGAIQGTPQSATIPTPPTNARATSS